MVRRLVVTTVVVGIVVSGLVLSALEAHAAGLGLFRFRGAAQGQAPARTYRSYSGSPESPATPPAPTIGRGDGALPPALVPAPVPARPGKPASSKPSYMRADSKARGRFGQ